MRDERFTGNDRLTEFIDGLYIGGLENNANRTLKVVDVWIHFGHESRKEMKLRERYEYVVFYPLRFDDGDVSEGQAQWLKAYELIKEHEGEKVLISCSEGVSRSAVMALWLCCEEYGDFDQALSHLKSVRKIHIDRGFHEFVEYLRETYVGAGL